MKALLTTRKTPLGLSALTYRPHLLASDKIVSISRHTSTSIADRDVSQEAEVFAYYLSLLTPRTGNIHWIPELGFEVSVSWRKCRLRPWKYRN